MRIHGLYLVKNEADIVRLSLRESARWCDQIYVFDNGSTDGTWEIVHEMSKKLPAVIPFKQDGRPFDDSLRAEIFNAFRDKAEPGDWWCRLDADELYVDDPKTFLSSVSQAHHVVWGAMLQYFLTTEDLARFSAADETSPPEMMLNNLPRYYQAKGGEPRFFRHRPRLEWPPGAWPLHLGLVEPRRIRVKHLQYRSPAQIQRRLDTRRQAAAAGWQHFGHSLETDWKQKISQTDRLQLDRNDGVYATDESAPRIHLEPAWQRLVKRFMHGFGFWP